jgi:hypothetical protein
MVTEVELPDVAAALSTLPRIDYVDCFVVDVAAELSGEEWARETLERAPASMRAGLRKGWTALGLRLDDPAAGEHVLGWGVRLSGPDHVLLGMRSRVGMPAELLFKPEPGRLLFATFVRHENVATRALWAAVEPRHRRIVPCLLDEAAARTT